MPTTQENLVNQLNDQKQPSFFEAFKTSVNRIVGSAPSVNDLNREGMSSMGVDVRTSLLNGTKDGLDTLNKYVQSGSEGISTICFIVGLITFVIGCLEVTLTVLNPMAILLHPAYLVIAIYTSVFGLTAACLEADLDKLQSAQQYKLVQAVIPNISERIQEAHKWILVNVAFLTSLKGRAFLYLFVGVLAASQCWLCPFFIVGLANLFAAFLIIKLIREDPPPDMSYAAVREAISGVYTKVN